MIKNIDAILKDIINFLDETSKCEKMIGYDTGFTDLNYKINGLQKGQLTVIAGRPSIGKTSFITNLAESMIFNNKLPVLFFSLESLADIVAMKLISSSGKVNFNHLLAAQLDRSEWTKVTGTILQLEEMNFSICDNPSITLEEIGKEIKKFCEQHKGEACIFIDDIQRIKPQKSLENKITRSDELTEISRYLKELALIHQIPIILVSQLNRNLENRPNKRPVISDLRDCGAIEDNADLIIFIYRDEVYNRESKDAGIAEIIIGKQRNGPVGTIRLAFDGRFISFSNLSPEFYAQYDDEE